MNEENSLFDLVVVGFREGFKRGYIEAYKLESGEDMSDEEFENISASGIVDKAIEEEREKLKVHFKL
jgi:hypothetical protein